jgi:hypothetical protein
MILEADVADRCACTVQPGDPRAVQEDGVALADDADVETVPSSYRP